MTRDLAPTPPDDHDVRRLIEHELGTLPKHLTTLRAGAWSTAIAVETNAGEFVLRFSRTPDDFRCDAFAAQFSSRNLPIPRVHGIGQLDERWWCLTDRMPGVYLDDLHADDMERTLPSIASMLIAMRDVRSDATTGYGGWDADCNGIFTSFAEQLIDVGNDVPEARGGGWSPVLARHRYEQSIFDTGLAELERLCAYLSDDRYLIHQDTLNYNVMVQDDSISGVFDWGCAMWGDAVYDLAWFRFWAPWYPQWVHLNIPEYLEAEVGTVGDHGTERMRCCLLHVGLMHIRYNAFIGNLDAMREVAQATERLLNREL